jgi:hypothetical protein
MNETLETNIDQPIRKKMGLALFRSACLATESIRALQKTSFSDITVAIRDPAQLREFTHQTNSRPFTGFPKTPIPENRVRSLLDWLTGIALLVIRCGLSEQEARYVEAEYRTGAILIIVEDEARWAEASAILQLNGGVTEFLPLPKKVPHHASFSNLFG